MECPRCEGEGCGMCDGFGWLCPECVGTLRRTPIYWGGRNARRCVECGTVVVDDAEEAERAGKRVPLRLTGN